MNKKLPYGFNVSDEKVASCAFKIIDIVQQSKAQDVITALALVWMYLCKYYKLTPQETMSTAAQINHYSLHNKVNPEIKAIQEYIEHDFKENT